MYVARILSYKYHYRISTCCDPVSIWIFSTIANFVMESIPSLKAISP